MAKLTFYYSAMNAGKSSRLLQAAHNYESMGMNVVSFTFAGDSREGSGVISSRIGIKREADFVFDKNNPFTEDMIKDASCIFIDEAQFLTKEHVIFLCYAADELDIPVECYGLRTDFSGELFEGSKFLLAWADHLIEIKSVDESGLPASMNVRLDENHQRVWKGDSICIGYNYKPVSRKHFNLRMAMNKND